MRSTRVGCGRIWNVREISHRLALVCLPDAKHILAVVLPIFLAIVLG
jgi:hypothetical protein